MEEIAERVAEGAPGLGVAAQLSALDDWRRNQQAHRKRVYDSHKLQTAMLGGEVSNVTEDDVGHLIVTGDIYGFNSDRILQALAGGQQQDGTQPQQPEQPPPSQPPAQPPTQETKDGVPMWAKAALIAAGLAGAGGLGAAVPWMLGAYSGDTTTTTNISQGEQQLGVDVIPGGAIK